MIGNLKLILSVYIVFMGIITTECQVTVNNLNGNGNFLCGYTTRLECVISGYGGGMTWKLDGTIIAQCAFQSCTALGALPSGDIFTPDEDNGKFNLTIGITHADNGTMYQCDDGSAQDQTTVNIQVPPSQSAFTTTISETNTSITVETGCFYPSGAGRMDVYCVNGNMEEKVENTIKMTPTTTGCTGDCAGPNIFTATGSISINSSNSGGNLKYRFKMYHENATQTQYVISIDSKAIYDCDNSTTSTSAPTTTTATRDNDVSITIITSIIGGCVILLCLVSLISFLYRRFGSNVKMTKASGDNHIPLSERKSESNFNNPKSDEINKNDHMYSSRGNDYRNAAGNYQYIYAEPYYDPIHTNSYSGFSSNTYHAYSSVIHTQCQFKYKMQQEMFVHIGLLL